LKKSGGIFDLDSVKNSVEELETQSGDADFWQNREKAEKVLQEIKRRHNQLEPWQKIKQDFQNLKELFLLALDENEQSFENEIQNNLQELEQRYKQIKIMEYLNQENDSASAFLSIHSGAGGTEACDWVVMLLRLYTRWSERHEYEIRTVDLQESEGGLKSVTIHVIGNYAFGYLKGESGIHRLVRISPFDSNKRRHTSFASIFCTPEIEDNIQVDINQDELRIDTYRAQGAGGQHVNKTDSAVRITHIPTGIVVQCQNERSQFKNKAMALKVMKSRLYEYYRAEQEKEREKLESAKRDISWGNQIRSYVFQPYTLVKDHRTKVEIGNIQAVMDGDIDDFIEEYLKYNWEHNK
jgi:peptide chain release factor 2